MFRKCLKVAYELEGITSAKEKKRVRNAVYRLDTDWDKTKLPSLAVAFGVLSLCKVDKRVPGWIVGYQQDAVTLSDRIDAVIKEEEAKRRERVTASFDRIEELFNAANGEGDR